MTEWLSTGLLDDVRPQMFEAMDRGESFALATIAEADGGPRPAGSQMVITGEAFWGFLSGGCIEADVVLHARAAIADGFPRRLVYGRGSPFIDIRLPCGGRLDVLVEKIPPGDAALAEMRRQTHARQPVLWESNGTTRSCRAPSADDIPLADAVVRHRFDPAQRLVVAGSDPVALAIAGLGTQIGWETRLLAPFGPGEPPPFKILCDRRPTEQSLCDPALDPWTAVAVSTHDMEVDHRILVPALRSQAGYVGVLGSRRKLADRLAALRSAGLTQAEVERLHAPIGLPIRARSPWEVAVSVIGEIIAATRAA